MKLAQIITALEQIAPTRHAESWDNVGLLVGDPNQSVSRAMLTIDYTQAVADEARKGKCDLIISYHPPIFEAVKKITSASPIFDAIRRGVAIYSPHTALDVASGGTNDMLADVIGLHRRDPLKRVMSSPKEYKLITFVPIKDVEKVSQALFNAGAGHIGNYHSCSFRTSGTGTFFGQEGTDPAVGKSGRLEKVEEIRLETVLPITALQNVVKALRASHPYEEPAFDLNMLAAAPEDRGMGRIGELPSTSRRSLFQRIKRKLGIKNLLIAGPTTGNVTRAAACAGSCGNLLNDAIAQKAQLYLTGEIRHHDALRAAESGMTVVCVLHSNSERAVLKRLAAELSRRVPRFPVVVSRQDRDPFAVL